MQINREKYDFEWNPLNFNQNYAVMILNRPIDINFQNVVVSLWNKASLRIAVDGAAHYAYTLGNNFPNFVNPDIISGDFDSAHTDILQHFKEKGTSIIHTPDQDESDFTKALRVVASRVAETNLKIDGVLTICSNGGRMDHIMGNIQTLFHANEITDLPVYLLSEESLTWLLKNGKHRINIHPKIKGTHCGLIPIGSPCTSITTTGLKWNLDKGQLKFGELVSTSNTYNGSDQVTIDINSFILWTMEIPIELIC